MIKSDPNEVINSCIEQVGDELLYAFRKHPSPGSTLAEFVKNLKEEVTEFEDDVKLMIDGDANKMGDALKELSQVIAYSMRVYSAISDGQFDVE